MRNWIQIWRKSRTPTHANRTNHPGLLRPLYISMLELWSFGQASADWLTSNPTRGRDLKHDGTSLSSAESLKLPPVRTLQTFTRLRLVLQ